MYSVHCTVYNVNLVNTAYDMDIMKNSNIMII